VSALGGPGVANSRASGWNRPPIHRMANLNVEPGSSTLEEMIASVRRGVLMRTNVRGRSTTRATSSSSAANGAS
jgi:predicted Zn-dependent protease